MSALNSESLANICLSGGADGADLQWGMVAGHAGHVVRHFVFQGHKSQAPEIELVVLRPEQLAEADPYLVVANKTLKRRFPTSNQHVNNLLRRNYYQVAWSDAVYAVASTQDGLVTGGTAWAVQMFLDRHQGRACPAYVFDQSLDLWLQWTGQLGWQPNHEPPIPQGVWAGIGSRDLKQNGKDAIRRLLNYTGQTHVSTG